MYDRLVAMRSTDEAPWYRQRGYAHFDCRPSKSKVLAYVTDAAKVARHGFFPFIMRPIRTVYFADDGTGRRVRKVKIRPVTVAAHMDTHIHAYYAFELGKRLEDQLQEPFGHSVLAYRRLPGRPSNVDFAASAFKEVSTIGECDVIAIDVEGFFDGLNHSILNPGYS